MAPLSSNRPLPVYDCKQNELYSAALIGWKSFTNQQTAFEAFNTIYTVAFGTTAKAAVESAKQLPDEFQRSEAHKNLRLQLENKRDDILIKWQQLESFINHAFSGDEYKNKVLSAGQSYYGPAANADWESVSSLLVDAISFITDNSADLTTGGMPLTFAGELGILNTDFNALYEAFTDAEQDEPEETDDKVTANNAVYRDLMKMFDDGQKIFRNDASVKARFTFSTVLQLIGGGTASDWAGYEVEDYFIGPGESVIVGTIPTDVNTEVYARVVLGSSTIIICTVDLPSAGPCLAGYNLAPQLTFKDKFSVLNLDMTKTNIQITNPGTEEVLFRAGTKK